MRRIIKLFSNHLRRQTAASSSSLFLSSTLTSHSSSFFTREESAYSLSYPNEYWSKKASLLKWDRQFDFVEPQLSTSDDYGVNRTVSWFEGGELNLSTNALDRHIDAGRGNQVAIFYHSPGATNQKRAITYQQLFDEVNLLTRVLRNQMNVTLGDTVLNYLPNCVECIVSMLASSRIGAPFTNVFGGFGSTELAARISHSNAKTIVTCSGGIEGGKIVDYVQLVDDALALLPEEKRPNVIFKQREVVVTSPSSSQSHLQFKNIKLKDHFFGKAIDYDVAIEQERKSCLSTASAMRKFWSSSSAPSTTSAATLPTSMSSCFYIAAEPVASSHPLFYIYTSGTTGNPKGIIRDTGGLLVNEISTLSSVYNLKPFSSDVMCTLANCGWIVGVTKICIMPLISGIATVLFEGHPTLTPDASTFFRIIEETRANVVFTAPTAMRAIRGATSSSGSELTFADKFDLSSLKTLILAGERSDVSTLRWCSTQLGGAVPVVDQFWQSEVVCVCSAPAISSDSDELDIQEGAAGIAAPGWRLECKTRKNGDEEEEIGELVAKLPLPPGALTGLLGDDTALHRIYCSHFEGYYCFFDSGSIDENTGHINILSRTDDVINVAAHRLSSSQLEEAIALGDDVVECAVVSKRCELKGEKILAFVVLKSGVVNNNGDDGSRIKKLIDGNLRKHVGAIAGGADIVFCTVLPKTKSGKILRRLLRAIGNGETDLTKLPVAPTIEDASILETLISDFSNSK